MLDSLVTVKTTLFVCDLLEIGLVHIFNMKTMAVLDFLWDSKCFKDSANGYEA